MSNTKCLHWNLHDLRTSSSRSNQSVFRQVTFIGIVDNVNGITISVSGNEFCFTHFTWIANDTYIATRFIFAVYYCPLMLFKDKKIRSICFKIVIKELDGRNCIINWRYFVQFFKCFVKIESTIIKLQFLWQVVNWTEVLGKLTARKPLTATPINFIEKSSWAID